MGSDAKKLLTILSMVITFLLLITGVSLSSSCILFVQSNSTYAPKVIGDGTGGAIAVYEEAKSGNERNFYAQRINSGGKSLWGDKGTLIGNSQSQSYSFPVFDIVGDGTGGALIAWPDLSSNQFQSTRYVTKIDSQGKILWQRNFSYFDQLISDGDGGVIIAFFICSTVSRGIGPFLCAFSTGSRAASKT